MEKAPFPKFLRVLELHKCISEDDLPSDYSGLYPHIQMVEELDIRDASPLGKMTLPRLKKLCFSGWSQKNLEEFGSSELPALEELILNDTFLLHLKALDLPVAKLDRLTLSTDRPPELSTFRDLAASPSHDRIRILDLRRAVDRTNAKHLAAVAKAFAQCEEVLVGGTSGELDRAFGSRVRVVPP
jgi:hypothetical protein